MINKPKLKEVLCRQWIYKTNIILVFCLLFLTSVKPAQASTLMKKMAAIEKSDLFDFPDKFTGEKSYNGVGGDEPLWIEENYHGFNIVVDSGFFYGVSMLDWPMDVRRIQTEAGFPWVMDVTLKMVKLKIDAIVKYGSPTLRKMPVPILVQTGYRGYNIFRISKFYYGLEQTKWPMTKEDFFGFLRAPVFSAIDVDEARVKIDAIWEGLGTLLFTSPVLVKEDYKGYNIVRFDNLFYVINQAEGPMNIWEIKEKAKYPWDIARTLEKAQLKVDEFIVKSPLKTKVKLWLKSFLSIV